MTLKEFYTTGIFKVDHRTFGGTIYDSDFETDYAGKSQRESKVVSRIISDHKFDIECMKNIENRNKKETNKNA